MKELQNGQVLTGRSIRQLFVSHSDTEPQEYSPLELTQVEFDAIRTPSATGWRHFMRLQGLDLMQGEFDLKRAAEMLAKLAWTPHYFLELLDAIRAEVGGDPAASLPVLHRRLLRHLSQDK